MSAGSPVVTTNNHATDEAQRLRALADLDVLDSAPEQAFDELAQAASLVCGVPISLLSLVDGNRQWFKARVGLPGVTETSRAVAVGAPAVRGEGLFEVPDATADPRFADNPLVTAGPEIRFYAGAPLRLDDGSQVGTLCVIDRVPRQLTPLQRQVLQHLATAAARALEARKLARRHQVSEARFRALSASSPLGVFATDATGGCTYTNAAWQSIYGMSGADSLGPGWCRTLHPLDRAAVFAEWQRTAELRRDFDQEFRVRHDDGSVRDVRCVARPVLDAAGRYDGHVGSVEDVSERVRQQRAIETERQRLAWIIDGTGAGTWEWNVQTGETRFNERWAQIVGRTLQELQPLSIETWSLLAHPDDLARSSALLAQHFGGESEIYECESRMLHRDGSWVWVLDRGRLLTRSPDGRPEWMYGTHLDITQRKRQEEALRKSQDLLDRTGRLAAVGGWELDVRSSELSWSEEMRRLHGVAPEFVPRLSTAIGFFAPEAQAPMQAAIEKAMAHGDPWDMELQLARADGRQLWVRSVGAAECEGGRPVRLVGALQDISARHAMDEVLEHKTAELKRSNEELERFAYVASHDLQEPLRMVSSYGQLLMRRHQAALHPEAQEFMRYMVEGGQRAQALIRDLLSLARLDSQARPWQPVALEMALAEALKTLRLRVQELGAVVTHDPLPTVLADARQIGQLMTNLLGNALKFCGDRAPVVHVGAVRDVNAWRISVRDNGIGIEPRYFERVFQMFQRLHLRGDYEGTGIGLTICKKVVERHGGRIGVESTPGVGSTFFFTLPDQGLGWGGLPARAPAERSGA